MTEPINFTATKRMKELAESANERIGELEHVLYEILDTRSLEAAKELAADILNEDLEIYLEPELDLDSDFQTFGEIEDIYDTDDK